ncbi:PREDICTED: reverse mRNAase [Prunus dulcis]|uniref:PREDICTED: reverse mRNAase n=1 Tax=Prunus dulcis TaxID=3755 RepID=A0A5E4FUR8_PRUDU|nr:PREDICTED: reverse mRNAase [Prunus dulcis]
MRQPLTIDTITIRNLLVNKLKALLEKDEAFWRQHSRVAWLKEGNRNSKFFHQCANSRRKRNSIHGLCDSGATWHETRDEIAKVVVDYFQDLFTSQGRGSTQEVLNSIEPRVSVSMNYTLNADFTYEEVKTALFQMHPTKAPGPNGMPPLFFQKFWHIVRNDVSRAVKNFLHSSWILQKINYTHVTLIPKVKNPRELPNLRPISLYFVQDCVKNNDESTEEYPTFYYLPNSDCIHL